MYLGKPGALIEIPDPRPGVEATADRQGGTNTTLGGRYRVDYPGAAPRTFALSWSDGYPYLTPEQYDVLERLYFEPGPYVFLPYSSRGRWNYAARTHSPWIIGSDTADFDYSFFPGHGLYIDMGTPVAPGVMWSFQTSVSLTSGTAVSLSSFLDWYDASSALISTTVGPVDTPQAWSDWNLTITDMAPSGAAFVIPRIHGDAMANLSYSFSKVQLEIGQPTTPLMGKGCPIVSFKELTMVYNFANQIAATASLVDVS